MNAVSRRTRCHIEIEIEGILRIREKCPIRRRRPQGIAGEERFLSFSAIPATAALQKAVADVGTSRRSFPQWFVAVSPPFTHNKNGKNNDKREAKGDEGGVRCSGIGSGGKA
jgi:hypothetical protein